MVRAGRSPADIEKDLAAYLGRKDPGHAISISGWERLGDGWECDIHGFVLHRTADGSTRDLVLRIYEGGDSGIMPGRFAREHIVMRRLRGQGFPVPGVHLFEGDPSHLGAPFMIMDRIRGELLGKLRPSDPGEMGRLFTTFCTLLARLHALDPAPFASDMGIELPRDPIGDAISLADRLHGIIDPEGLKPLREWFTSRSRRVPRLGPSIVHWDYHPLNVIVDESGRPHVIDWASAEITDHRFDVAASLIFLPDDDTRDRFTATYRRVSGRSLDDLDFFAAAACTRRLLVIAAILGGHGELLGLRPGLDGRIAHAVAPHAAMLNARLARMTGHSIPRLPGHQSMGPG